MASAAHGSPSIFPNMAKHVDKMAFIHSCWTETNNHAPALFKINTGMSRMGFPCVGSWVTYGLGTESQNLPAFVVMYDTLGRGLPKGHAQNWGAGFLPGIYQGTALEAPRRSRSTTSIAAKLMTDSQQRAQLDLLARLNRRELAAASRRGRAGGPDRNFELAYRMQMAAPEALDRQRKKRPRRSSCTGSTIRSAATSPSSA